MRCRKAKDQKSGDAGAPCEGLRVGFLHPDLGLGGAEQLVVLAAVGVQGSPSIKSVEIVTARHDRNRCFEETWNGTLKVTEYGNWLPRMLFGRAIALCAIWRMFWIFLRLLFRAVLQGGREFDILVVDQVSALNPLYKLLCRRLIFYCHHPDLLLCVERRGLLKKLYRGVLDFLEEQTTRSADVVVVNSSYTKGIVRQTFASFRHRPLEVLFPPIDLHGIERKKAELEKWSWETNDLEACHLKGLESKEFVVSLNRYERKKRIDRAIDAFASYIKTLRSDDSAESDAANRLTVRALIVAGGYDSAVRENVEVYEELKVFSMRVGLEIGRNIIFLRSISDGLRWKLLRHAAAVMYTPSHEHFGIVPLEAMAVGTPVIACGSGGPKETVINGETGILCVDVDVHGNPIMHEDVAKAFCNGLQVLLSDSKVEQKKRSERCMAHIKKHFGLETFTEQFLDIFCASLGHTRKHN